jgi:hypothetical protein
MIHITAVYAPSGISHAPAMPELALIRVESPDHDVGRFKLET